MRTEKTKRVYVELTVELEMNVDHIPDEFREDQLKDAIGAIRAVASKTHEKLFDKFRKLSKHLAPNEIGGMSGSVRVSQTKRKDT